MGLRIAMYSGLITTKFAESRGVYEMIKINVKFCDANFENVFLSLLVLFYLPVGITKTCYFNYSSTVRVAFRVQPQCDF